MLTPNPPYMMISPGILFIFICSASETRGYISDWNGISMAAVKHKYIKPESLVFALVIPHAAKAETTTKRSTEKKVTIKVTKRLLQKSIATIAF